jgi:hypothetical protein
MILNLGFLTEGKLAAILITPSSWGSQRAGHSPRINPREDMHRATIRSLGIVESKIREKGLEIKSTSYKEKQKEKLRYKFADNEYSESSEEERRQKRKEDARNIIAQARVNKSRHAWREKNYEDDEKDMGALCFTRRVRKTWVPKGFKLPHDQ